MFEAFDGIGNGGNGLGGVPDGGGFGENPLTGADGGGDASTNDRGQVGPGAASSFGGSFDSGFSPSSFGGSFDSGFSPSSFGGSFDFGGSSASPFGSSLDSTTSAPLGEAGNVVSSTGFGNGVAAASGSSPFGDFLVAPVEGWNGTPFASDVASLDGGAPLGGNGSGDVVFGGGMSALQARAMSAQATSIEETLC